MIINVGYFVETPVNHNLTGGSRSFFELVTSLKKMGINPFVVVSEEWKLTEMLADNGINYMIIKSYRPFIDINNPPPLFRIRHLIKTIVNFFAYKKASRYFKKNCVNIVHINSQFAGIYGAKVAKKLRIPYVYHIREFLDKGFGLRFYNEKKAEKLIGEADKIIAISSSIEEFQKKKHSDTSVIKICNGFDFSLIEKQNLISKQKFSSTHFDMCIVGRVCAYKNQLDAIKSVEVLTKHYKKDVCLYVIGYDGKDEYEKTILNYIKQNHLIDFVKLIPFNDNPFDIICNCDIGVICSEGEAFGRVTIEYFASKLLVFGAKSGATPELINDNIDGYIFNLHDCDALASLIKDSIDNPEKSQKMIDEGYKKAINTFSINKTAESVYEVYKELLK